MAWLYEQVKHNGKLYAKVFSILVQEQLGRCAVCGIPSKRLLLDHNHKTGFTRALVCGRCNVLLSGHDHALYERLAEYIRNPRRDIQVIPTETREYLPITGSSYRVTPLESGY